MVPGHIDHTEVKRLSLPLQCERGKTQIDGETALFLFRKPVGVHVGESLDQATFPVVHMTCRA
jgi:hypothetical protein